MLPSKDIFREKYNVPNKRLPEDNLFRKLIEETGCSINSLELALGEPINIYYNELDEKWEPKINQNNKNNSVGDKLIENNTRRQKTNFLMIIVFLFLLLPVFLAILRFTRGLGIISIIMVMVGYYLIKIS